MNLYHGSKVDHGQELKALNSTDLMGGIFNGIFMSPEIETARSHGDFIYCVDLDEGKILTALELEYNLNNDLVQNKFELLLSFEDINLERDSDEYKFMWDAIVADKNQDCEEVMHLFKYIDCGAELSWHLQSLRGDLASMLGYQAVEMEDEHGTSYLVKEGNILKRSE